MDGTGSFEVDGPALFEVDGPGFMWNESGILILHKLIVAVHIVLNYSTTISIQYL